jgi:hypothetical protein
MSVRRKVGVAGLGFAVAFIPLPVMSIAASAEPENFIEGPYYEAPAISGCNYLYAFGEVFNTAYAKIAGSGCLSVWAQVVWFNDGLANGPWVEGSGNGGWVQSSQTYQPVFGAHYTVAYDTQYSGPQIDNFSVTGL